MKSYGIACSHLWGGAGAAARGEELLEARAGLDEYSGPAIAVAAEGARAGAEKVRQALQAAGVARKLRPFIGKAAGSVRSAWAQRGGGGAGAAASGDGAASSAAQSAAGRDGA